MGLRDRASHVTNRCKQSSTTEITLPFHFRRIYVDELIQQKNDISGTPADQYPLQDLLYRTTALTNSSGVIIEAFDTDAYGNTLIFNAPGTGGNWFADDATQTDLPSVDYIFTGRRFDPEIELYFYRERFYDTVLGRFLSRDPIGVRSYDLNLYSYVSNMPTKNTDPSGLRTWTEIYSRGNDDLGQLQYETAKIEVSLIADTSDCKVTKAKPGCPSKCEGNVKVSFEYKATASTGAAQFRIIGARYGLQVISGPGADLPRLTLSAVPAMPPAGTEAGSGSILSGRISLGTVPCSGGRIPAAGINRIDVQAQRAEPPAAPLWTLLQETIRYRLVITSCGSDSGRISSVQRFGGEPNPLIHIGSNYRRGRFPTGYALKPGVAREAP